MGTVEVDFARNLRDQLDLTRAIETGTYRGLTARSLGTVFREVVTIELDEQFAREARRKLGDLTNVQVVQGRSPDWLRELRDPAQPTFYFLDAHWSAGATAGEGDPCPVLEELRAISGGHCDDCIVIDDARLFAYAPPPPQRPEQWPELLTVLHGLGEHHDDRVITVVADQIIAVPRRSKPALDAYGCRTESLKAELDRRFSPRLAAARDTADALVRRAAHLGR